MTEKLFWSVTHLNDPPDVVEGGAPLLLLPAAAAANRCRRRRRRRRHEVVAGCRLKGDIFIKQLHGLEMGQEEDPIFF